MKPHRNVQHSNCFFKATKLTLQMSQPTEHTYLLHSPSVTIVSRSSGIPNPTPREALTMKAHFVHLKYQPIDKSLGKCPVAPLVLARGSCATTRQGRGTSGMQLAPCKCGVPFPCSTINESLFWLPHAHRLRGLPKSVLGLGIRVVRKQMLTKM